MRSLPSVSVVTKPPVGLPATGAGVTFDTATPPPMPRSVGTTCELDTSAPTVFAGASGMNPRMGNSLTGTFFVDPHVDDLRAIGPLRLRRPDDRPHVAADAIRHASVRAFLTIEHYKRHRLDIAGIRVFPHDEIRRGRAREAVNFHAVGALDDRPGDCGRRRELHVHAIGRALQLHEARRRHELAEIRLQDVVTRDRARVAKLLHREALRRQRKLRRKYAVRAIPLRSENGLRHATATCTGAAKAFGLVPVVPSLSVTSSQPVAPLP